MHVGDVLPAHVVAELPDGLQEREDLDVADRAADLGDHDVDVVGGQAADPLLDLVGDVGDHLDGGAEVVAPALLAQHRGVDRAGGGVGVAVEGDVDETLVVPEVEVALAAVVGDEDLAVLERVHRAGVDVEVRVQLLHDDPQATRGQQVAEAGGGEALAQRGGDAPGDEDMLGRLRRGHARASRGAVCGEETRPSTGVHGNTDGGSGTGSPGVSPLSAVRTYGSPTMSASRRTSPKAARFLPFRRARRSGASRPSSRRR